MWDAITQWDGELLIHIQQLFVHDSVTPAVQFITSLGNGGKIWIVITLLMLCFRKTRKAGILAAIALILDLLIVNMWIKPEVARIRPYEVFEQVNLLVPKQHDYTFPSGHSAASFACAVVMFKELPRRYGVPALVLAFLIALSRLYVGVHYPLDVFCGMLIGTAIALLVCWAANYWLAKRKELPNG